MNTERIYLLNADVLKLIVSSLRQETVRKYLNYQQNNITVCCVEDDIINRSRNVGLQ